MDKFLTTQPGLALESTIEPEDDPGVFDSPKSTKVKTNQKISPLKICKEFLNEIVNEEKI